MNRGRVGAVFATVGVLVVVALVAMAVRSAMSHDDRGEARPFAADLADQGVLGVVSISPGSVGDNEMHLFVTPPGGSIIPVLGATGSITLDDGAPLALELVVEGPNHFSATIEFPEAGEWLFEVQVQVDESLVATLRSLVEVP